MKSIVVVVGVLLWMTTVVPVLEDEFQKTDVSLLVYRAVIANVPRGRLLSTSVAIDSPEVPEGWSWTGLSIWNEPWSLTE
ncbi:MAG TPA: hypothetical protein VMU58_02125 [Gaiellaceae bacterium]|nr:hypothetical protein [Gaiellaceae bacterium]